jgi:hypothetical protein
MTPVRTILPVHRGGDPPPVGGRVARLAHRPQRFAVVAMIVASGAVLVSLLATFAAAWAHAFVF